MSIVNCPNCAKRVSDLHPKCPACGSDLSPANSASPKASGRRAGTYVVVQSYAAILLALAGAVWYYRATAGLSHPPAGNASIYLIAAGLVWYVSLRAWMIARKILHKLQQD